MKQALFRLFFSFFAELTSFFQLHKQPSDWLYFKSFFLEHFSMAKKSEKIRLHRPGRPVPPRKRPLSREAAPTRKRRRARPRAAGGQVRRDQASPFWRAWRRCASAPRCTSATPASRGLHHWSTKWWTTASTRRWPATATHIEVTHERRRLRHRHRQRPRHPGGHARHGEEAGRGGRADRCCTPAASSTTTATRSPAACTASACPASTR